MLIKRFTVDGEKYYVNKFTGKKVDLMYVSPIKKEKKAAKTVDEKETPLIPNFGMSFSNHEGAAKRVNNQKSAFIGAFYEALRTPDNKIIKSKFIKACKRVNINPYPLLELGNNTRCILFNIKLETNV